MPCSVKLDASRMKGNDPTPSTWDSHRIGLNDREICVANTHRQYATDQST